MPCRSSAFVADGDAAADAKWTTPSAGGGFGVGLFKLHPENRKPMMMVERNSLLMGCMIQANRARRNASFTSSSEMTVTGRRQSVLCFTDLSGSSNWQRTDDRFIR